MFRFNFLLLIFLIFFLLRSGIQLYLNHLNITYLRRYGITIPEIFKDTIDSEKLKRITAYTMDSNEFHMFDTLVNQGVLLIILFSGLLEWLAEMISQWGYGLILSGLIFFAILSIVTNLFHIPFNLYETFVIEDRYGFNRMTFKMWILDLFKAVLISATLGGLVLWLLLALIGYSGNAWWVWAWMLVGCFELLMLWLFPVVIAPLFNKFEPIENKELEDRIKILMGKAGLRVRGIFKMDAGKRSKHTNAYFTGIGKTKRIVLFDTLLASHPEDEILSVLAHEIGHWKKKHVVKEILFLEILSLAVFYVTSIFLDWPILYQTFGFEMPVVYVGLFLIGTLLSPLGYFAQPLGSAISRRFEREADDFSLELMKTSEPIRNALKRLAADNLANLTPHPLYAWFYYSHPPLTERIERLTSRQVGSRQIAEG